MWGMDELNTMKYNSVKIGIESGHPNYPKYMELAGLDPGLDREASLELVKREIEIANERKRIYFNDAVEVYNDLKGVRLDRTARKKLESIHKMMVDNQTNGQ